MRKEVDAVVIGAGAIGLAVGRALSLVGRDVLILEAEPIPGSHTSSRNSEVIHAGIYYPRDSLKARLCVRGKSLLYEYCAKNELPHRRIGKLVVVNRKARMGRNPQTGEPIKIPAKTVLKFRIAKAAKEAVGTR